MLLANGSLSDFLNQAKYLEDTNDEIGKSVEDLRADKDRLEANKATLDDKNKSLQDLKNQLEDYQFISSRTTDRTIIDRLEERLAETIGNLIVMVLKNLN